jgi:hypothetical protein
MSGSPKSTETELRRAASAAWGPRPATTGTARPKMRFVSWEPLVKGSLSGFAVIELPNGLLIHDVPLLYSHSKAWTALPAKPQIDCDRRHKRSRAASRLTSKFSNGATPSSRTGSVSR